MAHRTHRRAARRGELRYTPVDVFMDGCAVGAEVPRTAEQLEAWIARWCMGAPYYRTTVDCAVRELQRWLGLGLIEALAVLDARHPRRFDGYACRELGNRYPQLLQRRLLTVPQLLRIAAARAVRLRGPLCRGCSA